MRKRQLFETSETLLMVVYTPIALALIALTILVVA